MMRTLLNCANELGESPVWCWRTEKLYWTDIRAHKIFRFDPSNRETKITDAPDLVASIGLHSDGGLILGMRSTIEGLNSSGTKFTKLIDVEPTSLGNRGNDGRVDRDGRFWFGTMNDTDRVSTGSLYLYDGETLSTRRKGIIVPNALCWSENGERMYFADSWTGEIEVWTRVSSTEFQWTDTLIAKNTLPGIPDGAIVDSEGFLWNARYGAGCVVRISPNGEVVETIEMPTKQVTSCALGGDDMRTLFVTSATQRMDQAQRDLEPEAGALFAMDVDVPGLPEPEFIPRGMD